MFSFLITFICGKTHNLFMVQGKPKKGFRQTKLKSHTCAECGTKITVVYRTPTACCPSCEYAKYIKNNYLTHSR